MLFAFLLSSALLSSALKQQYEEQCRTSSDIVDHIPLLHDLASQCTSVVEIGLRFMNSSWGLLQGLAESDVEERHYVGIDIERPPEKTLQQAQELATHNGISFQFVQADDLQIDIEPTDMLFIDSLHIYCHLFYELEKFSPHVRQYIAMHDTDEPWGFMDEPYYGDRSEYPPAIDRNKRGLWQAVIDFLAVHPEWTLHDHRTNCHGFTVLRRIAS